MFGPDSLKIQTTSNQVSHCISFCSSFALLYLAFGSSLSSSGCQPSFALQYLNELSTLIRIHLYFLRLSHHFLWISILALPDWKIFHFIYKLRLLGSYLSGLLVIYSYLVFLRIVLKNGWGMAAPLICLPVMYKLWEPAFHACSCFNYSYLLLPSNI